MTEFNRLYIIDKTSEPSEHCENTMSCPVEYGIPQYVDYCNPPLTLEEYKIQKNNPNLIAITWEEMEKRLAQYSTNLCGKWIEINEEDYDYALECLPPKKWRDIDLKINVFAVGECYTMNIYTHCIKDCRNNEVKYFKAYLPISSTNEEVLNSYLNRSV